MIQVSEKLEWRPMNYKVHARHRHDKSTKLASLQEANVTATVNGMQRYLELLIREEEEKENNPVPIKGKNQLDYEFRHRKTSIRAKGYHV